MMCFVGFVLLSVGLICVCGVGWARVRNAGCDGQVGVDISVGCVNRFR